MLILILMDACGAKQCLEMVIGGVACDTLSLRSPPNCAPVVFGETQPLRQRSGPALMALLLSLQQCVASTGMYIHSQHCLTDCI
uniref:Uncharacterized protein n=1 Tax=Anguilla anguilla TaxID=7936 RepID=A0A0E9WNL8_ANGAN